MKMVKDQLDGILVDLFHLPEYHILFSIHRTGIEFRVLGDIGDDLHHLWEILLKGSSSEGGLLAGGVGVQTGTQIFYLEL